jgi:hypothetical protein
MMEERPEPQNPAIGCLHQIKSQRFSSRLADRLGDFSITVCSITILLQIQIANSAIIRFKLSCSKQTSVHIVEGQTQEGKEFPHQDTNVKSESFHFRDTEKI